jgi:hypothetical protein
VPLNNARVEIIPSSLGAVTVALKFPAESVIWDGIFMGFAPNKVGDGINTALNATCIPGKGCKVTASINFPVITKALPCLTVGHGAIVKTDISEGCVRIGKGIKLVDVLFIDDVEFDISPYDINGTILSPIPVLANTNMITESFIQIIIHLS